LREDSHRRWVADHAPSGNGLGAELATRKSHNFADGLGSVAVSPVALTQPIAKLRRAPMGLGEEANRAKEVTGFTKFDG
jgi:hypothetical protein